MTVIFAVPLLGPVRLDTSFVMQTVVVVSFSATAVVARVAVTGPHSALLVPPAASVRLLSIATLVKAVEIVSAGLLPNSNR